MIKSILKKTLKKLNKFSSVAKVLGVIDGIKYCVYKYLSGESKLFWTKPAEAGRPVCIRTGSSDLDVFRQIFVNREYSPLSNLDDVGLVIDCGAYVGYASVWFLSQYPRCHVICVEPDPTNFSLLKRNLEAYGEQRVTLIQAGVWPEPVPLAISQEQYRDGRKWTVQVRPSNSGEETDFQGVTLNSLLSSSEYDRISILKMDVEGAEAEIFKRKKWLNYVDNIAIELHDDSKFGKSSDAFFSAIEVENFKVSKKGENVICSRP